MNTPLRILVTGITGFVGCNLLKPLSERGFSVTGAVRNKANLQERGVEGDIRILEVGSIDGDSDWGDALQDVDVVIHLANRAHVMKERSHDPLQEFRQVNRDGTRALAEQAMAAGVKRFVFVSSIKVNGEETAPGIPFTEEDIPQVQDPYGQSKLEAEQLLWELAQTSDMEVVVIRPPLVYGPGVKANFRAMMRWLNRGIPLPFGALDNRRSLIAVENLVDFIITCIDHSAAANNTFLVSDGEDLSTTDLLRRMAAALGRPARLLPVPDKILLLLFRAVGKPQLYRRLCGSLQLNISKATGRLGWTPPVAVDEALRRTATHYQGSVSG
jgi:UDP-glucose 4-epimerase